MSVKNNKKMEVKQMGLEELGNIVKSHGRIKQKIRHK